MMFRIIFLDQQGKLTDQVYGEESQEVLVREIFPNDKEAERNLVFVGPEDSSADDIAGSIAAMITTQAQQCEQRIDEGSLDRAMDHSIVIGELSRKLSELYR